MTAAAKAGLKSLAVWAGRAVLLASLVFIGFKLRDHWNGIVSWHPGWQDAVRLAAYTCLYCVALYLLAEGWHRIVSLFGPEPRGETYPSFTITQVAKYLPGNVGHFIGRGLYLRGKSLSDGQIVQATLIEILIMPAAAVVFVTVLGCAGQLSGLFPWLPVFLWWIAALFGLCAVALLYVLAARRGIDSRRLLPGLTPSLGLAAAFMAVLGGVFAAVFHLLGPAPVTTLAGAAVLAWLFGYVIPGAPGGLGAREAALVALLGGLGRQDDVLIAAALFRLATTFGDLFLFASGWLLFRKVLPLERS